MDGTRLARVPPVRPGPFSRDRWPGRALCLVSPLRPVPLEPEGQDQRAAPQDNGATGWLLPWSTKHWAVATRQ